MLNFLRFFFVLIILYHVLVTIVWYWILWGQYPELPSLMRDWLRIIFFVLMFIVYHKNWKNYFVKWKLPRIAFIIMMAWWIAISLGVGKSMTDILIGIKYWFFYIFIFLSASFLGFVRNGIGNLELGICKVLKVIGYWLVGIVIAWFIWQGTKLIWPDFFMQIWYWPLNDFFFGKNPPIYYLTWFEWTLRWQGLFSGPNNYGYFLVAFLPIILFLFGGEMKKWKKLFGLKIKEILNLIFVILWIFAILFTLSRTAILWSALVIVLLNLERIKKNKIKTWIISLIWIVWILALSILKDTSTLNHIVAKFWSLDRVIQRPMWMWLGTAWPAIHHNGSILPENYFIQVMIDVGTIWFILRAWIWYAVIWVEKKINKFWISKKDDKDIIVYVIWKYLNIGWLCFLVMWLFLHVFEDSMVNYLFFISYGLVTGYLTNNEKLITKI